jgi:hypothetical protein
VATGLDVAGAAGAGAVDDGEVGGAAGTVVVVTVAAVADVAVPTPSPAPSGPAEPMFAGSDAAVAGVAGGATDGVPPVFVTDPAGSRTGATAGAVARAAESVTRPDTVTTTVLTVTAASSDGRDTPHRMPPARTIRMRAG